MGSPRHRALMAVVLAAVLAIGSVGACSKDKTKKASPPKTTKAGDASSSATTAPQPSPTFTISGVDAQGTAEPDAATIDAVKRTLDEWVLTGMFTPLRTGQPAGDLSGAFTADALARLADPATRATLVDEGMPIATGGVTSSNATAAVFSVAGPDGVVALVGVRIELALRAQGVGMDVAIVRGGELVLAPDGDRWKIQTFSVHTARDSKNDASPPGAVNP